MEEPDFVEETFGPKRRKILKQVHQYSNLLDMPGWMRMFFKKMMPQFVGGGRALATDGPRHTCFTVTFRIQDDWEVHSDSE